MKWWQIVLLVLGLAGALTGLELWSVLRSEGALRAVSPPVDDADAKR